MRQNTTPQRLNKRQLAVIGGLVAGKTITDAATEAGVSRQTVHKWMWEPAFSEMVNNIEAEGIRTMSRQVIALGELATDAIKRGLGADQPMSAQLRAAALVLERGPALSELTSVIERLERLEAMQDENKP